MFINFVRNFVAIFILTIVFGGLAFTLGRLVTFLISTAGELGWIFLAVLAFSVIVALILTLSKSEG